MLESLALQLDCWYVLSFRLFGLDIQGRDCGDEVARWITTFLNSEPYRLVHFEPSMVPRKSKDVIDLFRTTDEVNECSCSQNYFLLIVSFPSHQIRTFSCLWWAHFSNVYIIYLNHVNVFLFYDEITCFNFTLDLFQAVDHSQLEFDTDI